MTVIALVVAAQEDSKLPVEGGSTLSELLVTIDGGDNAEHRHCREPCET